MVKLRILEGGPKRVKTREPAPLWGQRAGPRAAEAPGQRAGAGGPRAQPRCLLCGHSAWSDNRNRAKTQLPRMFWKGTLTRRGLLPTGWAAVPPSPPRGQGARLPDRPVRGNPTPHTRASSPLAHVRVIPPVKPHRPGVHAVVNGAVLEGEVTQGSVSGPRRCAQPSPARHVTWDRAADSRPTVGGESAMRMTGGPAPRCLREDPRGLPLH